MKLLLYWFCLCITSYRSLHGFLASLPPEYFYTTEEFIRAAGYEVGRFSVVTDDGYILSLHRIHSNTTVRQPAVLVQHGLMVTSDSWLLQEPGHNLPYMLSNAGYDVWLADIRGNYYSRKHLTLSSGDPNFWDFSWHEMGMYDLPAIIDAILRLTGEKQIGYVGHSMGTTMFFVMGSERPEYCNKISMFIGLAPIASLHVSNLGPHTQGLVNLGEKILRSYIQQGQLEILPRVKWGPVLAQIFCSENSITQDACYDFFFFWPGSQENRISKKTLGLVMSHTPAGFSAYSALHYIQELRTGRFQKRDYGTTGNLEHYGSIKPAEYNLSRISCPVALFYSRGDALVPLKDADNLAKQLPNVVYRHIFDTINHADYQWGRTAHREVYPEVIRVFDQYIRRR